MRSSMRNRRSFRGVPALLAAFALASLLIACGSTGGPGTSEDVPTARGGEAKGTLKISNWPLYIDEETIADFEAESGIEVEYVEDVNDNDEFFGKVQPLLSQGNSGGRSIVVVSDWMSKKMYDLGYLQNLDPSELTTVDRNMLPSLKNPSFDPERSYTVPWQSGMTGLVVRKDLASDIRSINDLFDPEYGGRVTMLREMRDTVPVVMMADGVNPSDATKQDWLDAIDKVGSAVEEGQVRRFTGNDYVQDLGKGDVVAAIGWSGDAIQAQADNENIDYVQPEQGCLLWSDNMSIPVGAPNAPAAYAFMNYVYEPTNMAQIVEWVNYMSPVSGVKPILEKQDPALAKSELIFPPEQFTANCSSVDSPPGSPEDVREVEQAWQSVLTG